MDSTNKLIVGGYMNYSVGDRLVGTINNIKDNGIFVSLPQETFGFMPRKLMPSLYDENGNFTKEKYDKIAVVIYSIDDKGCILSDTYTYDKARKCKNEQERKLQKQERIQNFVSNYQPGVIFEAEVIRITDYKVYIKLGDVEGIVTKEEASWNEINQLEDLLFEGEIINAVYLKYEKDQFFFSIKLLDKEPYDKMLYELSLNDLLKFAGYESSVFVGQAKCYGKNWFLENLYSDCDEQKGKILIDPIYGYNLRSLILNIDSLKENEFYKTRLNLVPRDKRIERNQLFQFSATKVIKIENPCREGVDLTFEKHTSPASSVAAAHLLSEVGKNMYSSKDRMFFELVQNADDAASKNGVYVNVKSKEDYLVIQHNGNSFDKDDFEAITSAANGTKKANENKTGYKGIGFKSVFTDSEQVYIKTGGYQFKFDKKDERFSDFENFYFAVNRLETPEQKREFSKKFDSEKRKFRGVIDIPWQLLPIWIDKYPDTLGLDFLKSNVAIALKLGKSKIEGENGYQKAIDEIISNPKFMLFLRNTKRIDFNGKSVSKTIEDNVITLKNSFNNNRVELFEREDFTINISNEVFENNGIEIRIKIDEKDERTGKIIEASLVDLHYRELENIPKKIAINSSSTISFAVPLSEKRKLNPNKGCTDISMFAFLPTLVKDFKFPFYINANFILDPPRQRILGDNPWNFYLMQEIAGNLVNWCAKLSVREDVNALNVLISEYFAEDTADVKKLAEHFNKAYKNALENEPFILNHNMTLSKQEEVIIDRTGLSQIVGASQFCEMIGTNKSLPSNKIDSSILKKKIFEKVESIQPGDIVNHLAEKEALNKWYVCASEAQKTDLYNWLIDNNADCKEIINSLPIFRFGDELKSRNHITNDSNYIISTDKIEPIKNILSELGYKCSVELLSNHPLSEYINPLTEKDLCVAIIARLSSNTLVLQPDEKILLMSSLAKFHGVGSNTISQIRLFCNVSGGKKPLCEMISYKENVPTWLHPYILCREESYPDLSDYLVCDDDEFSIIWKHKDKIGISITELYVEYPWSDGKYTKELINEYQGREEYKTLLPIIEESDKATQKSYLQCIRRLDLSSSQFYKKDSFEYRVLHIALSVLDEPSEFSSKVFFEQVCIKDFSITDDVICEYSQSGSHKKTKMSLSKLLPQYQNQSDSIEKIKNLFESKTDLDKFFNAVAKPINEVYNELNKSLNMIHATYAPWIKEQGNAIQYMFSVYQRKKSWAVVKGLQIKLEDESDVFIFEMMEFLFDNKIDIQTSPFTCHLQKYFTNKYFYCDYIFEEERLLPKIEQWADNDAKKFYLTNNGIKELTIYTKLFCQKFIANEVIERELLESLSDDCLLLALKFFSKTPAITRPFKGDNQKVVISNLLERKCCKLISRLDFEHLTINSKEWTSTEYNEWIKKHYPKIFLFPLQMPQDIYFDDALLMKFNRGFWFYDKDNQRLYVSNDEGKIDNILFEVAKEGKSDFCLDDYQELFIKGKISISKEEIKAKNDTIEKLEQQNKEKDDLIKRYREIYGEIRINDITPNTGKAETLSLSQLKYNKSVINRPQLSQEEQFEAHKEAEKIVREKLIQNGYDCSNWTIDNEIESLEPSRWHSVNQVENIIKPDGDSINLVIKSAKGGYIYLSATDFEFLTSDKDNVLMVWDGSKVHSVTGEQIFNKDSDVNLIFDTEYTPKHYYAALSRVFQYVKRTTFAVKNPSYNAYDAIQSFGMDSKTEDIQEIFDDNDL